MKPQPGAEEYSPPTTLRGGAAFSLLQGSKLGGSELINKVLGVG